MTLAVLIHEDRDNIEEIKLNINPDKNEIYNLLSGKVTFVGQWPEIDVVIIRPVHGSCKNKNTLPYPFHNEEIMGKILLVRMDENSEHQDFTKDEFMAWVGRKPYP